MLRSLDYVHDHKLLLIAKLGTKIMKDQFKLKVLTALIMSACLTACGGSSGSSSNNTTDQNTTDQGQTTTDEQEQTTTEESLANLSVQIIDGYLPSINVCIVDQKLECDDRFETTKTDDKGKASFIYKILSNKK